MYRFWARISGTRILCVRHYVVVESSRASTTPKMNLKTTQSVIRVARLLLDHHPKSAADKLSAQFLCSALRRGSEIMKRVWSDQSQLDGHLVDIAARCGPEEGQLASRMLVI